MPQPAYTDADGVDHYISDGAYKWDVLRGFEAQYAALLEAAIRTHHMERVRDLRAIDSTDHITQTDTDAVFARARAIENRIRARFGMTAVASHSR